MGSFYLCIPNGPGSFWDTFMFDPLLIPCCSQNGPVSRHVGTLGGPKQATAGSKRAETICLGIPCGVEFFLKKSDFLAPGGPR